jgi:RNA polymerase sigma factor (sigma-70 family)
MQITLSPVMAAEWRQKLLADREKTLEKIYGRTYPMVLHYIKQHGGTPEDAQDLLQEAIILFYEKLMQEELVLTASVTTYLMSICKNIWRQELEKRNRQSKFSHTEAETTEEPASPEPENGTLALTHFVAKLGQKCEAILLGFYYFGQSMNQLADQHQYRTVHSATVQKFKCLERLRKSLVGFTVQHFR